MVLKVDRRDFLRAAGAGAVGLAHATGSHRLAHAQEAGDKDVVQVKFDIAWLRGRWYFDPVGLYLKPGQKVRWLTQSFGGESVTAFHPSNDNHELRIPEKAKPFDSGFMLDRGLPGSTFEYLFEVEGTYDFYSRNHERLGAVGRIVVGAPGGPGEKPLGYGGSEGKSVIFRDVRKLLSWLTSEKIVREKIIPYPFELMELTYPVYDSHF